MIKITLAVLLGVLVGFLSFQVYPAQDTDQGANELSLYKKLGQWEGEVICKRK